MNTEWDTIMWQSELAEADNRLTVRIEATLDDIDDDLLEAIRAGGVEVETIVIKPDDGDVADRSEGRPTR